MTGTLSSGGSRLQQFLDGLPVETNWIAGHHIVWQTGQQNGPDGEGLESHTHCSALVAAIALYLDIYILRPPNHSQELLANAQVEWLSGSNYVGAPTASAAGWSSLGSSGDAGALAKAVAAANAGKLVFCGHQHPPVIDPVTGKLVAKSGHDAIIRPQTSPISDAGPLVTMAGDHNYYSIHMQNAFSAQPGAWPDNIKLFVHDTDLELDVTTGPGPG